LTPKQIYEEQLKLKKAKMIENESLYIRRTFFANKVFLCFNDDVILPFDTDFFTLEDFFMIQIRGLMFLKKRRMIRIKSIPNLALKYLLISLRNHVYLSNLTLKQSEILRGDTRHMKLYFGKVSSQIEFDNILFHRVQD